MARRRACALRAGTPVALRVLGLTDSKRFEFGSKKAAAISARLPAPRARATGI